MDSRLIVLCCLLVDGAALSACASPPRRLCLSGCVSSASIRANRLVQSCIDRVAGKGTYRAVLERLPLNALEIEPLKLLNPQRPSPAEAKALSSLQKEVRACTGLATMGDLHPDPELARLIRQSERDADRVLDELIGRRLSWGSANKLRFALATDLEAELRRDKPAGLGAFSVVPPLPSDPAEVER